MPLPRYNTQVPFQPVTPVGTMQQAKMFSSLADRLNEFTDIPYKIGAEQANEKGHQKALEDMSSGEPLKVEEGYGFYAKAYNKTAQTAFNSQVEADLKAKAEELSLGAKTKQEFDTVFSQYAKTSASKIEQPEFKAIYQQGVLKAGATYGAQVAKRIFERDTKNQISTINTSIEDDKTTYASSLASGDIASATSSMAKIHAKLENLVSLGEINTEMIPLKLKEIEKVARLTGYQSQYINEEARGNGVSYVKSFLTNKDIKPSEQVEMLKFFKTFTNEKHDALTAEMKNDADTVDAVSKIKTKKIFADVFSGKDVPDSVLNSMLAEGTLKPTDFKTIQETKSNLKSGAYTDDESVQTKYLIELPNTPFETIANDNRLTAKTKQELIKRKQTMEQTDQSNKALANAFTEIKQKTGENPWQTAERKVKASVFDDTDIKKSQQMQLEVIEAVRHDVSIGKTNVLDVGNAVDEHITKWQEKQKEKVAQRKKENEEKKYEKQMEEYNKSLNSTFGKLKSTIGLKPEPPKKP